MDVKMQLGSQHIVLHLEDNSATRDLVSRLPLTVDLEDFGHGAEKIFYTPSKLDTSRVRRDDATTTGTVAIFEPWGNICIFLHPSRSAYGLIQLGLVSAEDVKVLSSVSAREATLSLA